MEYSSSWERSAFKASEEITHILWNPKFITILTQGHHLFLFWARWNSCPPILISTLISFFHPCLTIAHNAINTFRKLEAQRAMQLWTCWKADTLHTSSWDLGNFNSKCNNCCRGEWVWKWRRKMNVKSLLHSSLPLFLFKKRDICCVGIYCRMLAAPIIPLSFSYHTIS